MAIGLPNIDIIFKNLGTSAIARSNNSTVALLLRDTLTLSKPTEISSILDIPSGLSADNKEQVELAFLGGVNTPKKIVIYTIGTDAEIATGLAQLETINFNYLAIPQIAQNEKATVVTWIKGLRENSNFTGKVVLSEAVADTECVINLGGSNQIVTEDKVFTLQQYCSRIAGILAGTPLNQSATYFILKEVKEVLPRATKEQENSSINSGKLILINNYDAVMIGRAVNSLTTTTADKGEDYKKIKIVDIMDMVKTDISKTFAVNYTGKYPNNYDNKCIFIVSVNSYLSTLEAEGILDEGKNNVGIDIDAHKKYLNDKGINTDNYTVQNLKECNTGSNVFLKGNCRPLDAMEDLRILFEMM